MNPPDFVWKQVRGWTAVILVSVLVIIGLVARRGSIAAQAAWIAAIASAAVGIINTIGETKNA